MKTKSVLVFILLMSSFFVLEAAEMKIAVVDMEVIFQGYYKTKLSDKRLKEQAKIFKEYAVKLNSSFVKLQKEFKALRDASQNVVLTEAERENNRLAAKDKYRQMKEKEFELREYNKEKQLQLRQKYNKMREKLLGEIKKAVKKYSVLSNYLLVLDKSGKTLNGIPFIVYNRPSIDLTKDILAELNKGKISKAK